MNRPGTVYLVGAGPGDPDLITVKGVKALQEADVVVYDRLANPVLLEFAPVWAERVYAGKAPGRHWLSQEAISALLVAEAQQGKVVVRLKGGDPFVFGRGGEEVQALAAAGVPFEVVPGISSALAVPAAAGIPVTHRNIACSFTVVTGHSSGDDPCAIPWETLPRNGTLVILMGVANLPRIAAQLIAHGRSPEMPAAVISQGTLPGQQVVVGTLADIAGKAAAIRPPATIVIGEVVALREEIGWYEPYAAAVGMLV